MAYSDSARKVIQFPSPFCGKATPDPFTDLAKQAPYPVDALGPMLSKAARAIEGASGASLTMVCNTLLGWLSFACQSHADTRIVVGSVLPGKVPISLFTLSVADSGARKSTVDALISSAYYAASQRAEDAYREKCEAYAAAMASFKEREKTLRATIKDASEAGDERAASEALARLREERPAKPLSPRRVYDDTTLEAFIRPMMSRDPSLGIITDEGGKILGGHNLRRTESMGQAASYLVGMWSGNISRPETVADQRLSAQRGDDIPHPPIRGRRVTVNISVQPNIVAPFLSSPILRGQGLISRFLTVMIEDAPKNLTSEHDASAYKPVIDQAAAHIAKIAMAPPRIHDGEGGLNPYVINPAFSPDASDYLRKYVWDKNMSKEPGTRYPDGNAMAMRGMEHLCRIAGVLAVSEYFETVPSAADYRPRTEHPFTVTKDIAVRATKLMKWYLDEAVRIEGAHTEDDTDKKARLIWEWIEARAGGSEPFTFAVRDVARGIWKLKTREDVIEGLTRLLERDLIEGIIDGQVVDALPQHLMPRYSRLKLRPTEKTGL